MENTVNNPGQEGTAVTQPPAPANTGGFEVGTAPLQPAAPSSSGFEVGTTPLQPQDTMSAIPAGQEWESGNANPNDPWYKRAAVAASGAVQGAGAGVIQSAVGLANLMPGVGAVEDQVKHFDPALANRVKGYIDSLTLNNAPTSTSQKVGGGLETLGEFMSGDEVFKGLGFADRMMEQGKIAKVLERFPKLMNALKLGVNVSKAVGELSPEEAEAVKNSPILARLVGAGYDATRAGAVQGAQTEAKTGDTKQAAKDTLEMAGTSAILGGGIGSIGGAAAKAGKTADVVGKITEAAKSNPKTAEVLEKTIANAVKPEQEAAQGAKEAGLFDIGKFAQGAHTPESLAESVRNTAAEMDKKYTNDYTSGIEGLKNELGTATIPFKDSPYEQAAKELSSNNALAEHPLDPGSPPHMPDGSPRVKRMVDFLAGIGEPEEAEPQTWVDVNGVQHTEPGEPVEQKPIDLDINELLNRRKKISEALRNTGWETSDDRADRKVYQKLRDGIDETIGKLSEQVATETNNPDILSRFKNINRNYAQYKDLLKNKDVQSLLEGNVHDVVGKLLQGNTAASDIDAVHQFLGDDNFRRFGVDALQRVAANSVRTDGTIDYDQLLKDWNKMGGATNGGSANAVKDEARTKLFGQFPSEVFSNVLNGISGADEKLNEINETVGRLMAGGKADDVLKDPARLEELQKTVGPDGMSEVGKAVLNDKLRDFSTTVDKNGNLKYAFDPYKFINWYGEMQKDNPQALEMLFKPTPETQANFEKLVNSIQDAGKRKRFNARLIKTGAALAGGATTLALGTAISPLAKTTGLSHVYVMEAAAGVLGALAGINFRQAQTLVDAMADNPKLWDKMVSVGKIADAIPTSTKAGLAKTAATKATYSAGKAVYGAAKGALGGSNPNDNTPPVPNPNQ